MVLVIGALDLAVELFGLSGGGVVLELDALLDT